MNKIECSIYDDAAALDSLVENRRAKYAEDLVNYAEQIKAAYLQYDSVGGNAYRISGVALSSKAGEALEYYYANPTKELAHIDKIRADHRHLPCAMCGSFHSETLDHIMPKSLDKAFSLYSKNLVPACKCNTDRGDVLFGVLPGERVLHPYFDDCLRDRLITARFTDLDTIPITHVELSVSPAHSQYRAISFHFRSIVLKTGIGDYAARRFNQLCRRPGLIIPSLKSEDPESEVALGQAISDERDRMDELHEAKNNWDSVFLSGLLTAPVISWLYQRMKVPGRRINGALGEYL
jgi:5-methylcytosine-specific restriction endonuclease McrA